MHVDNQSHINDSVPVYLKISYSALNEIHIYQSNYNILHEKIMTLSHKEKNKNINNEFFNEDLIKKIIIKVNITSFGTMFNEKTKKSTIYMYN